MQALYNQLMAGSTGGATPRPAVEEVFATSTYIAAGAQNNVVNNIDLAGKGGLVWCKARSAVSAHMLIDTAQPTKGLDTSATTAQITLATTFAANNNGFTLGGNASPNTSGSSYVAWTFAKASRFFDSVHYTGNGNDEQGVAHNLGAIPGMVIIKNLATGDWVVWHKSFAEAGLSLPNGYLLLNTTAAYAPTAVPGRVYADASYIYIHNLSAAFENTAGAFYVAYAFAHDPAADGIIQCGWYQGNGAAAGPSINLGWEPQFVMIKNLTSTSNWVVFDSSRGMGVSLADDSVMYPGATTAETADTAYITPTSTGFTLNSSNVNLNAGASSYIYMAIRKMPSKQPTSGNKVFSATVLAGSAASRDITSVGFAPDLVLSRLSTATPTYVFDREKGIHKYAITSSTAAELSVTASINAFSSDGIQVGSSLPNSSGTWTHYFFRKYPGVFDIVTWAGTGAGSTMPHKLGVTPELVICKNRTVAKDWQVTNIYGKSAIWNTTAAGIDNGNSAGYLSPTTFDLLGVSVNESVYASGSNYIAYLFATKAGVSKVGQYAGDNNSTTGKFVDCGFAGAARFVMIKNMDAVGDWMVWDFAHGIVANSSQIWTPISSSSSALKNEMVLNAVPGGFTVLQTSVANANILGNNYLFLAFA